MIELELLAVVAVDERKFAMRGGAVFLIGPERKRGSVTSTATTKPAGVHPHDTPAICDLFDSPELVARGAEGELDGPRKVESASDGARWA